VPLPLSFPPSQSCSAEVFRCSDATDHLCITSEKRKWSALPPKADVVMSPRTAATGHERTIAPKVISLRQSGLAQPIEQDCLSRLILDRKLADT
jgi:hypothetical protein